MNRKVLIDLIGILLIALVVVVGYKLSPLLMPRADLVIEPDAACDLHRQACAAHLPDGGRIELSTSQHPIPMVTPFQVEVRLEGLHAAQVAVDFAGVDMNMGLNRVALKAQGDGRYVAEASLPVCVTGRMDWLATVLIDTGARQIAVPYRFAEGHH